MIRAEQIPDEVVRAALLTDEWLGMREVIAAALNAWPDSILMPAEIVLPLPLENANAEG